MNLCRSYFHESGRTRLELEYREGDRSKDNQKENRDGSVQMEGLEESQVLAEVLMQLPDMQREAVLLHHFYGYKNREIARMTGASYAAVKSRINQGIDKLKDLLDKEDFYE